MVVTGGCPDADTLRVLALGRMSPEEVERLAEHCEHCERCVKALHQVCGADTLVEAMFAQGTVREESNDKSIDDLISRLKQTCPIPVTAQGGATMNTIPQATPSSAEQASLPPPADGMPEVYDFLHAAEHSDEIGRLGNYGIRKVLGTGGMGVVFLAEDPQLKRLVALKVLKPALAASGSARERFLREAQATASLDHDRIVHIYQVGEDRGVPFLAMQLLKGETLDDRLRRQQRLPPAEVMRLGQETAEGLAAAHAVGLIHRDIKPSNLWLEGERGRVKVLDFGLVRAVEGDVRLTQSGAIAGTPAYMAPEQAQGQDVDARCDLFSLGCVLYRAATGELPFKGGNTTALLLSLVQHQPAAPHELNPEIPRALSDLVMSLLSKDPARRPATARALADALRQLGADITLPAAFPPGTATLVPRSELERPRRRWLVAVATILLLVGGAFLVPQIVLRITDREGNVREVPLKPGDKFEIVGNPPEKKPDTKPVPVAVKASFLDKLDPAQIPPEDRFPWQPKELVAVLGEHRQRHWGAVTSVAYSPDGKLIASAGGDGIVCLWDAATMRRLFSLREKLGVSSLAFSHDGKTLACNFYDASIHLWDLTGPEPRHKAEFGPSGRLAYAPKDNVSAAAYRDTVRIWDMSAAQPKLRAEWKTSSAFQVAFSPDGNSLATFGADLRLWDLSRPEPTEKAVAKASGRAMAFAPDGKTLVTSDDKGMLRFWDATELRERGAYQTCSYPDLVHSLAFSRDGTALAVGGKLGTLWLWDLTGPEPKQRASLTGHRRQVFSVAFAPDGKSLVSGGGEDMTVRRWDLTGPQPKELLPVRGDTMYTTSLAITPDGKTLASGGGFNTNARLWDLSKAPPKEVAAIPGEDVNSLTTATFSPDGRMLMVDSRLWDISGPGPIARPSLRGGNMNAFTADGKFLAAGRGNPMTISIWDLTGAEPKEQAVQKHAGGLTALAWSPARPLLAIGEPQPGTLLLWEFGGKEPKQRALPTKLGRGLAWGALAFAPDGKTLLAGGLDGLQLWDLSKGEPMEWLTRLGRHQVDALAFSPDGALFATTGRDGHVILWDANSGKSQREWHLPGGAMSVAFAPDGRHLFTGNNNGTIYVLRLSN